MEDRINRELKYYCLDFEGIREVLRSLGARYVSTVKQEDYFYKLPDRTKRLKLRSENGLDRIIYYYDNNQDNQRTVRFQVWDVIDPSTKQILDTSLGVKTTVKKKREKWQLANKVFHLDDVESVGKIFEMEIEEIKNNASSEVNDYLELFKSYLGKRIVGSNEDLIPRGSKN